MPPAGRRPAEHARRSAGPSSGGPLIRLHATLPQSRANGPGLRGVVWFQGCSLGCRGCFNPETHAPDTGTTVPVESLAREILESWRGIEGITVSGGEPFQQPRALAHLLREVRTHEPLSVLLFSGYRLEEIHEIAGSAAVLDLTDVLIAGRFVPKLREARALIGSANQTAHFLTDRYGPEDLRSLPAAEIVIDATGRIVTSGIAPPDLAALRAGG